MYLFNSCRPGLRAVWIQICEVEWMYIDLVASVNLLANKPITDLVKSVEGDPLCFHKIRQKLRSQG